MPELPEVETIRRDLHNNVIGCRIVRAEIHTPEVLINQYGIQLEGAAIDEIQRRGKYLLIRLTGKYKKSQAILWMIVHLRMTGRFYLQDKEAQPGKHVHASFHLACLDDIQSGRKLVFQDTRRFGRIWLLKAGNDGRPAGVPGGLANLGPEPLEAGFTPELLAARLDKRPRSPIKAALLDQTIVAGLGNIYVDESLFAAKINPARKAGTLTRDEVSQLVRSIREVLARAISCNGTTLRDYVDGWNRKGNFQELLQVYGRSGEICSRCGSEIRKAKLAGRTTCWCPVCQPGEITPG